MLLAHLALVISILVSSNSFSAELSIVTLEEHPFGYYDQEGSFTGISVDIINEIQKRLKTSSNIKVYPWSRAYHLAKATKNTLIFTVSRIPKRENDLIWLFPIAKAAYSFFVKKNSGIDPIQSLDQLKTLDIKIGVMRNGVQEGLLKAHQFPHSLIHPVTKYDQALHMLNLNRVTTFFANVITFAKLLHSNQLPPNDFEAIYTMESPVNAYIAISKSSDEQLIQSLRKIRSEMIQDGSLKRIYEKWITKIYNEYGFTGHIDKSILKFTEK